MYCKHCGNQIADDSVFCSKCGKLVIEANHQPSQTDTTNNVTNWVNTGNLQWKKPIIARYMQIILIVILGLLLLYLLYCFVSGGNTELIGYPNRRIHAYANDPWRLKILEFTSVSIEEPDFGGGYGFLRSDVQRIFRTRIFLLSLPIIALIWLVIRWMQNTRFPGGKDVVPRDIADEIELYNWDGFTRYKYVFFKKDGKYGIIDARNYCVNVPARYDSIVWRMPNKTFDVTIGEDKQTLSINKLTNPSKDYKTICVLMTSITLVCTIFAIIIDVTSYEDGNAGAYFLAFILFAIMTFFSFSFKNNKDK